jgi:hypothetical protein
VIREWLEALLTPAPPEVRRLGYVSELVAIGARERRQSAAWAGHLRETHAFVEDVATGGGHLVLLGSGRLLDVPLERIAKRYERVTLVDCVHPRAARRRAAACGNATCLVADVTGCVAALARAGHTLPRVPTPDPLAGLPAPTTTLSLNLASQLPIMPLQWALARGVPEAAGVEFGRALIDAHFAWLAGLPGRVAVVTDVRRDYTAAGAAGQVPSVESEDALLGARRPPPDLRWTWDVAPPGEIAADLSLALEVHAWRDWHRAWATAA